MRAGMMAIARPAALTQFGLVAVAFGCLTQAYVTSDFSVLNVFQNSHTAKPLLYKISGVWGNHEGSMLLWALVLEPQSPTLLVARMMKEMQQILLMMQM